MKRTSPTRSILLRVEGLKATPLLAVGLLAGCATLPSFGPTAGQIRRAEIQDNETGFSIIDITAATLAAAQAQPSTANTGTLPDLAGRTDTLGPGDVLAIDIYEVGVTLFARAPAATSAPSSFSASAANVSLSSVVVDANGDIYLPYVGRVNVLNATPAEVERKIEMGMMQMSQHPQAVVTVKQNAHNVVYVSGDVRTPGRLELGLPRERLLDAVARAGGTIDQPDDVVVRLSRDKIFQEVRLGSINATDRENVLLMPADRIELLKRPRTFLVFGATEKVSQVSFGATDLSLAEALARIGGPSDRLADPKAVYLFRWGPSPIDGSPAKPVIYRLNMLRADSYFMSQHFSMQDKDVIYIASAASNAPMKLTQIIGQLFSPFAIARSTVD